MSQTGEEKLCPLKCDGSICAQGRCEWWINYGQDDGGCAMVWAGECIEFHVQRFCQELNGIAVAIGELRKELAKHHKKLGKGAKQ